MPSSPSSAPPPTRPLPILTLSVPASLAQTPSSSISPSLSPHSLYREQALRAAAGPMAAGDLLGTAHDGSLDTFVNGMRNSGGSWVPLPDLKDRDVARNGPVSEGYIGVLHGLMQKLETAQRLSERDVNRATAAEDMSPASVPTRAHASAVMSVSRPGPTPPVWSTPIVPPRPGGLEMSDVQGHTPQRASPTGLSSGISSLAIASRAIESPTTAPSMAAQATTVSPATEHEQYPGRLYPHQERRAEVSDQDVKAIPPAHQD